IRTISSVPRNLNADSIISMFNSDNSLVVTGINTGATFLVNPVTGEDIYTSVPGWNAGAWDANDPKVYYYLPFLEGTIHRVTLISPPTNWTDEVWNTYPVHGN